MTLILQERTVERFEPVVLSEIGHDEFERRLTEGSLPKMAGGSPFNAFTANSAKATLAAGTARTCLQLVTNANPFVVCEMGVSCNGTTGFLLIEMVSGTNASNEKEATELTAAVIRGLESAKASTKAFGNYTALKEPTALTVLKAWEIPQSSCPFVIQFPLNREPGSFTVKAAAAGIAWGLRLTAVTGAPEVRTYAEWEE